MTNKEKLRRAVIEAIHGLPYAEAVEKEKSTWYENQPRIVQDNTECEYWETLPVTIGRVMQFIKNITLKKDVAGYDVISNVIYVEPFSYDECLYFTINWKLTKENGQECTLEDQSDETVDKLLNLLTN